MQGSRGSAKIILIVTAILFLTSLFIFFIFINKEEKVDLTKEKENIEKSLSIDERADGIVPENIVFSNIIDNYARGKVTDSRDGIEKDFYAMKINGVWRIVEISNMPVSCERYARLGFSSSLISDCRLTFSDAVSISEIDATLDQLFLESNELKVIGLVEDIEETEEGKIITVVSEDGSSIKISVPDSVDTTEGDLIVTTITAPIEYISNNTSEVIFDSNNTVVVNEDDKDLFSDNIIDNGIKVKINWNKTQGTET